MIICFHSLIRAMSATMNNIVPIWK
jgi:hypothetical protein